MDGDLRKYTGILEQISRYRCGVDLDSRQFFGIDLHFTFFFIFFPNFSGASHQSWGAICDKLVDPAECGVTIRRTYLTYLFTYTPFAYCIERKATVSVHVHVLGNKGEWPYLAC